ncbi:MAG: hypothetical protein AB9866_11710 [Syntrophobacteraceae bacterium]
MLLLRDINHVWAQATQTTQAIPVTSYLDTSSAGWAYKKSDYAFVAEIGECRIQWNAVEMKEPGGKKHLSVRRCCLIPFSEQIPFHRAILKEIFSKWPATEFDNISWGGFGQKSDWSWSLPIAIASSRSKEFKNYRENYPKGNVNINRLFVKLANETNSYDAFRQLLLEFGADIELSNVEKVFVLPARELPFYPSLKEQGINPKSRVIYDVAFSYFKITKP